MKPATRISAVLFLLIAAMHLVRLFKGWEVMFNGRILPMWPSAVAFVVAGGLAVLLWREARR